ncbi:MAG: DUF5788 family protein [Methanomassiliicoccus sp.]|nr:DUF5788 family protein [Methanomassiliicoccus sp.]
MDRCTPSPTTDMVETRDVCEGSAALTKEDRAKIVSRIHSLLFWVGEMIPQEIRLENRSVPLRDVVFRFIMSESPSDQERKDVARLAQMLDQQVKEIETEIKTGDVTRTQACELMNEARSYLRAVDELRTASGKDAELKRHALMTRVEDARRWKRFVEKVR